MLRTVMPDEVTAASLLVGDIPWSSLVGVAGSIPSKIIRRKRKGIHVLNSISICWVGMEAVGKTTRNLV